MVYKFRINDSIHEVNIEKNNNEEFSAVWGKRKYRFSFYPITENYGSLFIDSTVYKIFFRYINKKIFISINGENFELDEIDLNENSYRRVTPNDRLDLKENQVFAPMPGKILKLFVSQDQIVKVNEPLFIMESMKMENEITSPMSGKIHKINFGINAIVSTGDLIIELKKND
jgi:biotin carboxyl carrier protein